MGGRTSCCSATKLAREAVRAGLPNRMAPNTAAALLLVGLALLLLDARSRRRGVLAGPARGPGDRGLIALLAIIGYAYSAPALVGIEQFIPMALNTAVALAT